MAVDHRISRPLLGETIKDVSTLLYPLYVSPKIDGIRCIHHPMLGPVSRKFKDIPNDFIREQLIKTTPPWLDGELVALNDDGSEKDFNATQSAVMSKNGTPRFVYRVFDWLEDPDQNYCTRLHRLLSSRLSGPYCKLVPQQLVHDAFELASWERTFLTQGYEGLMARGPEGGYKCGRSTLKQQFLLKLKRWSDAEGVVVAIEELLHNENELTRDMLGLAERSSHKANKTESGMMGKLVLQTEWGVLRVGTGFDHTARTLIWDNQEQYLGKTVTFKYQEHGMQTVPRFPVFMRFRED